LDDTLAFVRGFMLFSMLANLAEDRQGVAAEPGADWQIHAYGHTVHAFTNPAREGMYSPTADARSWRAMQNFLEEIFT
ncbi:MAG: dienelactone hydrolase family protein, partial [Rhizorhabdus sp.]